MNMNPMTWYLEYLRKKDLTWNEVVPARIQEELKANAERKRARKNAARLSNKDGK